MALYAAVGLKEDGAWDILGLWVGKDFGPDATEEEIAEAKEFGLKLLAELAERGVETVDMALVDGLVGFDEAFAEAFPDTAMGVCALVWLMNSGTEIAEEDTEALLTGLNAVYTAATLEVAQAAAERFETAWGGKYPELAQQLKGSEAQWSESFDAAQAARGAGYDLILIEQTLGAMSEAVGERYRNGMDAVYAAFIQVLKFFPEY
jgi:transposase-like protein